MCIGRIRLMDTHHAHSSLNLTRRLVTVLAPLRVLRTRHTLCSLNSVPTLTFHLRHPFLVLYYSQLCSLPAVFDRVVGFRVLRLPRSRRLVLYPIADVEVNIVHIRLITLSCGFLPPPGFACFHRSRCALLYVDVAQDSRCNVFLNRNHLFLQILNHIQTGRRVLAVRMRKQEIGTHNVVISL
jgi:hypothetical protein